MAAFIASIEMGFRGRRAKPLSERISSVAALSANSPGASSTNSTRSPAERPSFCRTATGTVIRPLLVNLVAVIALLRGHPDCAVEADHFPVQHHVAHDLSHE